MREECQAVIVIADNGEPFAFYHPMVIAVITDTPGSTVCGKPAVEVMETLTLRNGTAEELAKLPARDRLTELKIPLCAEHWDLYQKDIKENA